MATNNEFIGDALRLLGVLDETESPSSEQSADALVVFNDMMGALEEDGVSLGYAPQSDPTLDNGLGIGVRKAIKYLLAVDLAPKYQRSVSAEIAVQAMNARNQLYRAAINLSLAPADMTHMPAGAGDLRIVDIVTGI